MYYKVSNMFDYLMLYAMFKNKLPQITLETVLEKIKILEDAYGKLKDFKDYGSCVLFFPNEKSFDMVYEQFLNHYHVDDDLAEYEDELVEEDGVVWKEKLFILGSETGVVLVYPERGSR